MLLRCFHFPKNKKWERSRSQAIFTPHIEDQIVWIAIVNIVAHFVEPEIPVWSYGKRIFRRVWKETVNGKEKTFRGSYSSDSPNLYRKWSQSWPVYRRHIAVTIKTMGCNSRFDESRLPEKKKKQLNLQEDDGLIYPFFAKRILARWRTGVFILGRS